MCYILNMNNIKENIAKNILRLRTEKKITQPELARQLNYSDKSVSKWENGISTPPIDVLKEIADLFEVSLDDLVNDPDASEYDRIYTAKENKRNKIIITLLAILLVWLAATVFYVYGSIISEENNWILFVFAVPASSLVALIFNLLWGKRTYTFIIVSIALWSTLATIYLEFLEYNPWMIFVIGVPFQIATILWSQLKKSHTKK